jgi:transcriptional regulator of aromatic amino acid metabolism
MDKNLDFISKVPDVYEVSKVFDVRCVQWMLSSEKANSQLHALFR